jgi:hypothetical protein
MLLNVPVYKHISKIRETIGRSLDELSSIAYLRKWDIKPMITKQGYKLVLEPGEEVLRVLAITQKKQLADESALLPPLTPAQQEAVQTLLDRGVSPIKANALVRRHQPDVLMDQVEYSEFLISRDKRGKIENPAGFIIYAIENGVPVPTNFVTSRRLRERQNQVSSETEAVSHRLRLELAYDGFIEQTVDQAVRERFPDDELGKKVKETVKQRRRTDEVFAGMSGVQQTQLAERLVWQEVRQSLEVPRFEEWCKARPQLDLF